MALYYAPAIGSYLIGKCLYLGPRDGYVRSSLHFSISLATAHSFLFISRWLRRARSYCFSFLSYHR
jgi:alpha-1,3-glucosyltransferase